MRIVQLHSAMFSYMKVSEYTYVTISNDVRGNSARSSLEPTIGKHAKAKTHHVVCSGLDQFTCTHVNTYVHARTHTQKYLQN